MVIRSQVQPLVEDIINMDGCYREECSKQLAAPYNPFSQHTWRELYATIRHTRALSAKDAIVVRDGRMTTLIMLPYIIFHE